MLETENKHLIEGVVMVIFYLEMSFTGKFTLVYFFYHYRTFCMPYILSEIIFQFDFLRYKIVIYMYIYNLILFVWFQILHLYFFLKHFFTHCNSLYILFLSSFSPFPPDICFSMSLPYGKAPNYIQFPPSKITLKNFT